MRIYLNLNRFDSLCELLKTDLAPATQVNPPHYVGQLLLQRLVTYLDHKSAQSCLIYTLIVGLGNSLVQVTNVKARQRVKIFL